MSLFGKIFGDNNQNEEKKSLWHIIRDEEDLKIAIENSYVHKIGIFKHSTRCFISKTVLKNLEKEIETSNEKGAFYFLDLIQYRNLSNKIAEDFDVRHESPQLIIFENGKVINSASHQDISLSQITS